jgi:hypothetical protein
MLVKRQESNDLTVLLGNGSLHGLDITPILLERIFQRVQPHCGVRRSTISFVLTWIPLCRFEAAGEPLIRTYRS